MDLAEIRQRVQAAREFVETVDGASFTLRMPTRLDSRVALARVMSQHGGETDNNVLAIHVERESLVQAIVGWSGVPVVWLLRDHPSLDEQCEFQRGFVGVLLDERPDVADQLSRSLFARVRVWNELRDTAAKN